MKIFITCFKQTFKSVLFVFKNITMYFVIYLTGIVVIVLLDLDRFLPFPIFQSNTEISVGPIIMLFGFLFYLLTAFMVAYYAYKYNNRGITIKPLWIFIGETVWPVILYNIIAFIIILLFFLLPFTPLILIFYVLDPMMRIIVFIWSIVIFSPLTLLGIYKCIRYSFLTPTLFFDETYKRGERSALKTAQMTTKGYFWLISLFMTLNNVISVLSYVITEKIIGMLELQTFPSQLVIYSLWALSSLYTYAFSALLKNQFYFALKKHRMETISL